MATARAGDGDPSLKKLAFNRDIRPILADKCFKCHGPDAKQRKGKLRLDDDRAAQGRRRHRAASAIVPGKLDESELYRADHVRRPRRADAAARQRQAALGRRGRPAQDLDRGRGRSIEGHWAFIAADPARRCRPVKNRAWCRNPIDAFILARLEAEGLAPSPEADKVTLLRRLSLDLIGLPPTIREERRVPRRSPRRCL